jgi:hypothetical protein
MQRTPYSGHEDYYQGVLQTINKRCGLTAPTDVLEIPQYAPVKEVTFCLSDSF